MSEWLQVKSLEMLVSKSEFNIEINKESDLLSFSCDLLNIARGRCDLIFNKKSKITKSHIFISTEKPVMKGEIDLLPNKFENILSSINKLSNIKNSKKLKIILYLDKPLAVNNHGVLSLDKDVNLEIINLKLVLPII
jgi:hypothetical protein